MKFLLSPYFWFGLLVVVAIGYIFYLLGLFDWLISWVNSWTTPATTTATIGLESGIISESIIVGGAL